MRALLIGFGDLAQRLAPKLLASGWAVTGLRRSPVGFAGVEMLAGDCRDPQILGAALNNQDVVVVSLTPDSFSEESYRKTYVESAQAISTALAVLEKKPRHLFWVSSTSVYGQGQGEWVDENSETAPTGFSGQCLLQAEQIVAAGPVPATIVRFSGIYGGDSTRLLDQVRAGRCAPAEPVIWTNRIHRDDCAGVLYHLMGLVAVGGPVAPRYLGTDCEPTPLHDVHLWMADKLAISAKTAETTTTLRGNRRCSNSLLLASGYQFIYPTFREGYSALLDREKAAASEG